MITPSHTANDERLVDTSMELSGSQINSSHFQCSQSFLSSESDLSFSSSVDQELDALILDDELPAFEIRLVSPLGRTPSPIDTTAEDFRTPTRLPQFDDSTPSECLSSDFVTLQEINSLISPPPDYEESKADVSRCNSLETIFEGVFLNTPPKKANNVRNINLMRENLFEKMMINRMCSGKENQSPNVGAVDEISKFTKCYHPKEHIPQANIK